MSDKSWMLNPQAIRYAKACIEVVKQELGVKLKLSHPEFLQMLHEYVDLTESEELGYAYSKLISMAGPGTILKELQQPQRNVVPIQQKQVANGGFVYDDDLVEIAGKAYPKWREGKSFKGIYRGQPIYQ